MKKEEPEIDQEMASSKSDMSDVEHKSDPDYKLDECEEKEKISEKKYRKEIEQIRDRIAEGLANLVPIKKADLIEKKAPESKGRKSGRSVKIKKEHTVPLCKYLLPFTINIFLVSSDLVMGYHERMQQYIKGYELRYEDQNMYARGVEARLLIQ